MNYTKCIYTIKHSDDLNDVLSNGKSSTFREYKNWKGAQDMLTEAKKAKNDLIIIFSPAESTDYLHSWAIISDIRISDDKTFTDYSFYNLTKIENKIKKSSLVLLSTGKKIEVNFIRPYALCLTPVKILNNSDTSTQENLESFVHENDYKINENILSIINEKMKKLKPEKVEALINKSIRGDSRIVSELKKYHKYQCQFPECNSKIKMKNGDLYVEVAHIRPVSKGGQSIIGNILVLCPNHHKEFDFGDLKISNQKENQIEGILNEKRFNIKM